MRRAERSTTIRVRTRSTSTWDARTQPVTPLGRSGTWTRYHLGRHRSSTRWARIEKIVGTWLTFSRPKVAKARPPGRRETAARDLTTAANAALAEPTWWRAAGRHVRGDGGAASRRGFAVPPQPAARSASNKTVKTLCRSADNNCNDRASYYPEERNDPQAPQAQRRHSSRYPAARRCAVSSRAKGLLQLQASARREDHQARSRVATAARISPAATSTFSSAIPSNGVGPRLTIASA